MERFEEETEGVDAVNRDGAVQLGRESELGGEDGELFVERGAAEAGEAGIVGAGAVEHPAVEADFSDGGVGIGDEVSAERFEPGGRTVTDVPRMQTVTGSDVKGLRAER